MTVDFSPLDISCLKELGSLRNLFSYQIQNLFSCPVFSDCNEAWSIMDRFSSTNEFLSQIQYLFSSFSCYLVTSIYLFKYHISKEVSALSLRVLRRNLVSDLISLPSQKWQSGKELIQPLQLLKKLFLIMTKYIQVVLSHREALNKFIGQMHRVYVCM